jgi:phospholipid/cholesterol/gamma-HCH transport system permease protein
MIALVTLPTTSTNVLRHWLGNALTWSQGWAQIIHLGAQILVLALSPSSYRRVQRRLMAHSLYRATRPLLPSFTWLSAVVALVIIRIVVATSLTYGLSRFALDVLVRTLVLELIPLSAALVVAVRYSLAAGDEVRALRADGGFEAQLKRGIDPTRDMVLPRVLASCFAVLTLALLSSVITLVLTYLSVYGFALWGIDDFTRSVGQVFNPVIGLIFLLKTVFFSLAVAVIPMVTTPRELAARASAPAHSGVRAPADLTRLARLLAVIMLIEVSSLVGNYY